MQLADAWLPCSTYVDAWLACRFWPCGLQLESAMLAPVVHMFTQDRNTPVAFQVTCALYVHVQVQELADLNPTCTWLVLDWFVLSVLDA